MVIFQIFETYTELLRQRMHPMRAFLDEETRYKFQNFGKFQFIYFSLLNFKDLFNTNYCQLNLY